MWRWPFVVSVLLLALITTESHAQQCIDRAKVVGKWEGYLTNDVLKKEGRKNSVQVEFRESGDMLMTTHGLGEFSLTQSGRIVNTIPVEVICSSQNKWSVNCDKILFTIISLKENEYKIDESKLSSIPYSHRAKVIDYIKERQGPVKFKSGIEVVWTPLRVEDDYLQFRDNFSDEYTILRTR